MSAMPSEVDASKLRTRSVSGLAQRKEGPRRFGQTLERALEEGVDVHAGTRSSTARARRSKVEAEPQPKPGSHAGGALKHTIVVDVVAHGREPVELEEHEGLEEHRADVDLCASV